MTGLLCSTLLIQPLVGYAVTLAPTEIECESEGDSLLTSDDGGSEDNFVGEIVSFFTDLINGLVGQHNIAKVVDIHQIFRKVMSGNLPEDAALSNASENNLSNSYAQRKDYAETLQRKAAVATVEDTTLGEAAQELTKENCIFANDATEIIYELGEESQNMDTSQHILQNISAQLGQKGTVDNLMKEELTLMRQDLALSAVLQSQIAEGINKSNIVQRREKIASQNYELLNNALITLPGGLWEEAE